MKFILLSILFLSQTSFAELRYDKLLQTISEERTVSVSAIEAKQITDYTCEEYEDGNYFDGKCIKDHYTCRLQLKFPGHNLAAEPEAYEIKMGFSLLDFEITTDQSCEWEFRQWQSNNFDKQITYYYEEKLYRINYQERFPANCFQIPSIRIKTSLDIYPIDWIDKHEDSYLGSNPKHKVSCDTLDKP